VCHHYAERVARIMFKFHTTPLLGVSAALDSQVVRSQGRVCLHHIPLAAYCSSTQWLEVMAMIMIVLLCQGVASLSPGATTMGYPFHRNLMVNNDDAGWTNELGGLCTMRSDFIQTSCVTIAFGGPKSTSPALNNCKAYQEIRIASFPRLPSYVAHGFVVMDVNASLGQSTGDTATFIVEQWNALGESTLSATLVAPNTGCSAPTSERNITIFRSTSRIVATFSQYDQHRQQL
jgi:hypothetical protein